MFKLAKYDIKGSYKLYLIVFISSIILSLGVFLKQDSWQKISIFSLITLISVALFIIVLVFSVRSFRNELYEDRGYLTFTLPVSGKEILIAKILVTLLWFAIATVITGILEYFAANLLFNKNFINMIFQSISTKSVIISIIYALFNMIFLMITIYSAITISKVTFKK